MLAEGYLGEQMIKRRHNPAGVSLTLRAISGMGLGLTLGCVMGMLCLKRSGNNCRMASLIYFAMDWRTLPASTILVVHLL